MKNLKNVVLKKKIKLDELEELKPCRPLYTDYYNIMAQKHDFTVPGRSGSLVEVIKNSPETPFALSHRCPMKWFLFFN